MLAEQRRTRGNKLTCDEGVGDWRRSCWRDRSAIVCLWSDDRAFDGPHIEEAMVTSGVDRKGVLGGQTMDWECGGRGGERLFYGWKGGEAVIVVAGMTRKKQ